MSKIQKNLVDYLLQKGFKNNGLFSPLEIIYMAQVNRKGVQRSAKNPKEAYKAQRVACSDRMAVYLVGEAILKNKHFTEWTRDTSMYVTFKKDYVLAEDSRGFKFKQLKKAYYSDPKTYDISETLGECVEFDWPTVYYKLIDNNSVRDFVKYEYDVKFEGS